METLACPCCGASTDLEDPDNVVQIVCWLCAAILTVVRQEDKTHKLVQGGRKLTLVAMAFHDVCFDFLPKEGFQERKAQYLKHAATELQMLETVLPDLLKEIMPAISSAPSSPQTTNFLSTISLLSCHVCGDQMIGLCKTCGARTDPQPGELPAQGIGGHYSCVICGMAMNEPCEHWRGLAMNAALDLNAESQLLGEMVKGLEKIRATLSPEQKGYADIIDPLLAAYRKGSREKETS